MTKAEIFQTLLQRLVTDKESIIGWEEVRHWPNNMMDGFLQAGLFKPAAPAAMTECTGCYEQCLMPVHVLPGQNGLPGRAFIACDRRDDMGKVKINLTRLEQWQFSRAQFAFWLARELEIKSKPALDKANGIYQLGSVQGKKRLVALDLAFADNVVFQAAGHALPLLEAMDLSGDALKVDRVAVVEFLDLPPAKDTAPRYTPSTARREARKLDTQAMYQNWRKAYRQLKKDKPNMTDVWYSRQIAKMEIAQGRDAETIRKYMNKS